MNGVLRAMLEGVIDYAGLFPPSRLPMPDSVKEYLAIVNGPDKWIVDRFACPAGKLQDLAIELAEYPDESFIPVSVIATVQPDHKHWKQGLEHDAAEMIKFQKAVDSRAEVQAYEARIPDHARAPEYVGDLKSFANVDLFVELPWGAGMADSLSLLAEIDVACAKARTGGLEASAYPSAPDLAAFIQQCVQLDLSFKLTAGLHHPLPTLDPATGATMYGFLNVIAATTLALAEDFSQREIEALLSESNPKAFTFRKDTVLWKGNKATLDQVENARTLLLSFGSCSVQEPLEGLAKIGLVEKETA